MRKFLESPKRFVHSTTLNGSDRQLERRLEEAESPTIWRLMIPLVIANLTMTSAMMITGMLLVDIGHSFGVPVGIAGQIQTAAFAMTVAFALLMGVLSVRFSHKTLLMIGLLCAAVSALGSALAQNFITMLLVYSMCGISYGMVAPMTNAIIGENLPVEKRGSAMGWNIGGQGLAALCAASVVGLVGDWRLCFGAYVMPSALLSLLLALRFLPSASKGSGSVISGGKYLQGFGEIFSNRSAFACLLGVLISATSGQVVAMYYGSFLRQRFLLSTGALSVFLVVCSLAMLGCLLLVGRYLNRFGRKPLTILAAALISVASALYASVPNIVLSMILITLGGSAMGMRLVAGNSLTLEQVPKSRGTMMSLNQAVISTGQFLGTAAGGLLILLQGYEMAGIIMAAVGLVAIAVFSLFTVDPTRRVAAQALK